MATAKTNFNPGDLVLIKGNATSARVLEVDTDRIGNTYYNLIIRRGNQPTIQRVIYPDQIIAFSVPALMALLGGASNVVAQDEDGPSGDFKVTVFCEQPEAAQMEVA